MPRVGSRPADEVSTVGGMTARQAILTTLRGDRADRIPFFHYWRRLQTGTAERVARNRGIGVGWVRPCYVEAMPHVETVERTHQVSGTPVTVREYHTPVGTVTETLKREPGVGQWKAQRSWRDVIPWRVKRRIQAPEDYAVVRFMVEDTVLTPDAFPIEQAKAWLGEDGVVVAGLPHSPMQRLMIDWIGTPRFYIHYARYRDRIEELYQALATKYEELYAIAAASSADLVNFGDNLDGVLVNPRLFEAYFMPCYEQCARALHGRGKLMASHFDGRLDDLKELIAACPQDVIEAFHPPPMGDLPLTEALRIWQEKRILVGLPGSVYAMGVDAVDRYTRCLLRSAIPGDRLAMIASTENLVSDAALDRLSVIMARATLPLTAAKLRARVDA